MNRAAVHSSGAQPGDTASVIARDGDHNMHFFSIFNFVEGGSYAYLKLDVRVPQIVIPVAPGRNIAVLAEAAVRSHMLKTKGFDPAQTFIDRQAHQMRRLPPW